MYLLLCHVRCDAGTMVLSSTRFSLNLVLMWA